MQVLVRGDDGRGDFRALQQLAEIGSDEIRLCLLLQQRQAVLLEVRHADEVDLRVARGDLAAEETYAARADDGETDAFRVFPCHGSNETGSFFSADRSAAM